jgi:hypothetical protein
VKSSTIVPSIHKNISHTATRQPEQRKQFRTTHIGRAHHMLRAYMRACEAADASADAKSFHSGYPETAWMGIHTPFILDVTVSPGQLRQSSNNKIMQHVIKNLLANPHPATIALASYV